MDIKKTIKGKLGDLELIETKDGSVSINSVFYNENCHSLDGARSETIYNFIEGCEIVTRFKHHSPFTIFETGLGLGYGLDCTLDIIGGHPLLFISTEIEPELISYNKKNKNHLLWQNLKLDDCGHYIATENNQTLVVLNGDATKTIEDISFYLKNNKINALFQDAFSPKKNPELWTEDWFRKLKQHAHDDCIMSTYCASRGPLEAMALAGWNINARKGFGRKKSSTVAFVRK